MPCLTVPDARLLRSFVVVVILHHTFPSTSIPGTASKNYQRNSPNRKKIARVGTKLRKDFGRKRKFLFFLVKIPARFLSRNIKNIIPSEGFYTYKR